MSSCTASQDHAGCAIERPTPKLHQVPLRKCSGETKTEIIASGRQHFPVADDWAHILRIVVPRAAAKEAVIIRVFTYPFPNVASHIIQTIAVRLLLTHRMRLSVTVAIKPPHRIKVITATIFGLAAAIAGVLPFRTCWQAILLAGLGIQLLNELLGIIPAHVLHRAGVTAA
jgi:hypothetical protein